MDKVDIENVSSELSYVLSKIDKQVDIDNFLKDILTKQEIQEFSRRLTVAQMLDKNTPYSQIEKETWMSSTTISRVSKFLKWEYRWYKKAISILKSVSEKHHIGHHSKMTSL